MHTPSDHILASPGFNVAVTAAATAVIAGCDTRGYRRVLAVIDALPTGTGTTVNVKLQDSADNATFADVTGVTFTQVTTVLGHTIQLMNINPARTRRYLGLVPTGAGGSAAGQVVGLFLLMEPHQEPVVNLPTPISLV